LLKKIVSGTVLTLLLIIIVTLACNCQGGPVNGYLEDVNGALVLHVWGDPYDMGEVNGSLLKDSIKEAIQSLIDEMENMGYNYTYLANCAETMEQYIPEEYIKEMEGLADGANITYTDVLVYHVIADTLFYGPGWTGCSGFAVFGNATNATGDGHLYHGRSFDSPVSLTSGESTGLITVYEPENGNTFVNVGWFGFIGVYTGMNKEGITVEMNASSSNDTTLDGMPIAFMLREVLEDSNNLTQAIDIINSTNRTVGWNIVLGDGKNLNACVVEVSANYCKVFGPGGPEEDIEPHYSIPDAVRRTNHYVDTELAATQRSPYDPRVVGWNGSWNRYETLSQLIEYTYGDITAEMSIEFLQMPHVAVPQNQQSVVFDATDLELWVANARNDTPAYLLDFIYLSYDDLFPE